ncbi:MAG: MFS transporter [Chloroflexota bacterium]|nr:MFS transporter [Chloroflexota bacterium]MDQ3225130.1 MFS transporter [Chloroflexota bacterium]
MSGSRLPDNDGVTASHPNAADAPAQTAVLPLGISLAILLFAYWCVDIVSPALPAIRQSLALSATSAGFVFSVFFAGRLITNLPAAWLVERIGPKRTAVVGSAVLLTGSALAASASSQATLLPARGMQGVGVAILATAGLLSVLRALPGGGSAMTAFNVAVGVGGSGGLLSGGYLTSELGWRAVFWLSTAVSGLLLAGSLLARVQPAVVRPDRAAIAEAVVSDSPSRRAEVTAVAANLLVFINYSIWVVSLPLLGAVKFGFDAGQVGLTLLFVNVVHLASAIPIGGIIRKAGAARALALGFGVGGIGLLLAPLAPSPPWLLAPLALYAIGQVAGNSSAGDLILRLGGGGGRAVGAVRLSSDVGLVAGPAAVGLLADVAGVEAPFFALGVIGVAAMTGAIVFGSRRSQWKRMARR